MYQLRAPAPALRAYVEHYWFVSPDDGPVDLRVSVFVDARADLIFNFGAPYLREVIGGGSVEHARSNLDAQRLDPIRIVQRGLARTTGVRFHLGGLGAFSRRALDGLTGSTPEPAAVLGEGVAALEAALVATPDPDGQTALLDAFLEARLVEDQGLALARRALRALEPADPAPTVGSVAAHLGVSARQLDRVFARYVGIPPKTIARVQRFQHTLRALMRDPGAPLATVGAAAGYFDQAHFVREFKRMTGGGVPRGYRGYFPPAGPSDFAPNVVVFVQDGRHR